MWDLRIIKILCFLKFCSRTTDGHNSTKIERISFMLEQFCPDDGICLSNRTDKPSKDSDSRSCCSECSCDDTCLFSKSCCFPEMAKENDVPSVSTYKTCLYPSTINTDFQDDHRMKFNSYYMITSEDGATSQKACGNEIVASWGSMYPVYSKQKDMLFKNPVCAEAYGADDGILWTPFLTCKTFVQNSGFANDGATFALSPGVNYIPDDCSVIFEYSEDDIESHVCYNPEEFINSCKYSEFRLPTLLEQYKGEITSACTSGLISPYKNDNLYANVFCFICNVGKFDGSDTCSKATVRSLFNMRGFVGLLNIDLLQFDERRTKKRKFQMACQRSNVQDTSCREIYCSSGKSRDFDGNCYFSTKRWYTLEYGALVNLTSAHDIDTEQVFIPGKEMEALKRTWPKNSFVYSISHLMTKNSTVSKNFLVLVMLSFKSEIDPKFLIAIVDKMIHRQWGLFIGDVKVSLQAKLSKFQDSLYFLYPLSDVRFPTEMTFEDSAANSSLTLKLPAFRQIYKDDSILQTRWPPFYISKLYYCEQVDLYDSEFVLSKIASLYVLYNKLTGQFMYDGEYTLINKNGVLTPRVCLESSGLVVSMGIGNGCYGVYTAFVSLLSITSWHSLIS